MINFFACSQLPLQEFFSFVSRLRCQCWKFIEHNRLRLNVCDDHARFVVADIEVRDGVAVSSSTPSRLEKQRFFHPDEAFFDKNELKLVMDARPFFSSAFPAGSFLKP